MSKHTPGPWRELVTRIDDANGYQICHLDLHGKSEAERDANRRLIAAAPDLLEALKEAEPMLDAMLKNITRYLPEYRNMPALAQARAAIKKAEGQA